MAASILVEAVQARARRLLRPLDLAARAPGSAPLRLARSRRGSCERFQSAKFRTPAAEDRNLVEALRELIECCAHLGPLHGSHGR
jgi:hypothetical protein